MIFACQLCSHRIDKFRVNDNSRRHVFCWAVLKLLLGLDYPVTDAAFLSLVWKCFDSTCSNGHSYVQMHLNACI